jgi:hypothetical protein
MALAAGGVLNVVGSSSFCWDETGCVEDAADVIGSLSDDVLDVTITDKREGRTGDV